MSKFIRLTLCLLIAGVFLVCGKAQEKVQPSQLAADEKKAPRVMDLLPPQEIFFFNYIFQPDNEIHKASTTFDLHEYRLGFEPWVPIENDIYAGIGVLYTAYNFRFDFDGVRDNRTLHAITFPITIAWLSDQWMAMGRLEVGIKSDCRGFNPHDMQVNATLIGGYMFDPTFLFEFGLALVNDFGDLLPIPVIGCEWKALDPYLDISVLAPFYARINLHPLKDNPRQFTTYLYYELDGDQFHFRYRENGRVREDDAQFTFYRLGVGVEYELVQGFTFHMVLGGDLAGEYEFRELANKDKGQIDAAFVLMVGVTLNDTFFGF